MYYLPFILIVSLLTFMGPVAVCQDTDLSGAWEASIPTDSGTVDGVMILIDGYMSTTYYSEGGKKFYWTAGGSWVADDDELIETYEFHTDKPSKVGNTESFDIIIEDDVLVWDNITWKRVDNGTEADLAGAWLITGRKTGEKINRRTRGARKTMKLLSGTRFQWIAYNTETGEFFGTGGGTYTAEDGKYTENIGFFSRDSSRVGASLEFDYKLEDGEWHHSGLSSKGDPIYEIWELRSMLEQ